MNDDRQRHTSVASFVQNEIKMQYEEIPMFAFPGMQRQSTLSTRQGIDANNAKSIAQFNEDIYGDDEEEGDVLPGFTTGLLLSAVIGLLSSFVFGFQIGVMNAPKDVVFPGKTEVPFFSVVWV
jgi:hypothetical protein